MVPLLPDPWRYIEALEMLGRPYSPLREADARYARSGARVTIYIQIAGDSVQQIAATLNRLDLQTRRITALLAHERTRSRYFYRVYPSPPGKSGLTLEDVTIGSYRGRHTLRGETSRVGKRHPIAFAVLVGMLSTGAYDGAKLTLTEVYDHVFQHNSTTPPRPPDDTTTIHIDIHIDGHVRGMVRGVEPGSVGFEGAPAHVTIVIEGEGESDGRGHIITFDSDPKDRERRTPRPLKN